MPRYLCIRASPLVHTWVSVSLCTRMSGRTCVRVCVKARARVLAGVFVSLVSTCMHAEGVCVTVCAPACRSCLCVVISPCWSTTEHKRDGWDDCFTSSTFIFVQPQLAIFIACARERRPPPWCMWRTASLLTFFRHPTWQPHFARVKKWG